MIKEFIKDQCENGTVKVLIVIVSFIIFAVLMSLPELLTGYPINTYPY